MSDDNTQDAAEPSPASSGSVANPLEQIIRGTVRLHELIEQGRCDSEEADAVRDAMDAPFLELSESEREAASLVSAAIGDREWIPVTERLPDIGVCLAAIRVRNWHEGPKHYVEIRYFDDTQQFRDEDDWLPCSSVTHWMPLPAPPQADK